MGVTVKVLLNRLHVGHLDTVWAFLEGKYDSEPEHAYC